MAVKYTEEQLNTVDKSFLIHLLLQQQEQLEALTKELHASNEKMQLLMEQVILGKQNRFGGSSEKMEDTGQIRFREVDGSIVFFNEAEAVSDLSVSEPEDLELRSPRQPKRKGKKRIFPDFRSGGSTTICLRPNWKKNSVRRAGNNYRMRSPENIVSCQPRWKWKNITLVYTPAKQMNIWSKQTIQSLCCMEVWYPHLWQLRSSTVSM